MHTSTNYMTRDLENSLKFEGAVLQCGSWALQQQVPCMTLTI